MQEQGTDRGAYTCVELRCKGKTLVSDRSFQGLKACRSTATQGSSHFARTVPTGRRGSSARRRRASEGALSVSLHWRGVREKFPRSAAAAGNFTQEPLSPTLRPQRYHPIWCCRAWPSWAHCSPNRGMGKSDRARIDPDPRTRADDFAVALGARDGMRLWSTLRSN